MPGYKFNVECPKSRLVIVMSMLASGKTLPDPNGTKYSLNDRGELCYTNGDGDLTVSGISFNEFSRKVQVLVERLVTEVAGKGLKGLLVDVMA